MGDSFLEGPSVDESPGPQEKQIERDGLEVVKLPSIKDIIDDSPGLAVWEGMLW